MAYPGSVVFIFHLVFVCTSALENICDFGSAVLGCSLHDKHNSPILTSCVTEKLIIVGPCCKSADNVTIKSIDLGYCGITSLGPYLEQLQNVVDMSIQNTNVTCDEDNFIGLTNLHHLWMSDVCNGTCPGMKAAWHETSRTDCINQTNTCLNEACATNGACEDNGPGLYHCVCESGYHGYRCLREGDFPAWQFAAIIGSPTVILSGVLWYFTLRKTPSITTT